MFYQITIILNKLSIIFFKLLLALSLKSCDLSSKEDFISYVRENIDSSIKDYIESIKIPEKTLPIRLWYMYKENVCTLIDVDDNLKAFDKDKFEEGFKNVLGEYSKELGIKYDEKAFINLVEIINNKKAQKPDGSFTDEYTDAIKKALNFIPYNANDDTARKIVYGVGEAAFMVVSLGAA